MGLGAKLLLSIFLLSFLGRRDIFGKELFFGSFIFGFDFI